MATLRIALKILSVLNLIFVLLTAMVGAFADGDDAAARVLLTVLHPITAAAIVLLAYMPRLPRIGAVAIAGVLVFNIAADAYYATMIALGNIKGDWEIPMLFLLIPAIALVYALLLARSSDQPTDDMDGNLIQPDR